MTARKRKLRQTEKIWSTFQRACGNHCRLLIGLTWTFSWPHVSKQEFVLRMNNVDADMWEGLCLHFACQVHFSVCVITHIYVFVSFYPFSVSNFRRQEYINIISPHIFTQTCRPAETLQKELSEEQLSPAAFRCLTSFCRGRSFNWCNDNLLQRISNQV